MDMAEIPQCKRCGLRPIGSGSSQAGKEFWGTSEKFWLLAHVDVLYVRICVRLWISITFPLMTRCYEIQCDWNYGKAATTTMT